MLICSTRLHAGPVGQATGKGVTVAAKLTVAATREAVRLEAPVGSWALKEGARAALGLLAQALEKEKENGKEKGQQGRERRKSSK